MQAPWHALEDLNHFQNDYDHDDPPTELGLQQGGAQMRCWDWVYSQCSDHHCGA